MPVTMIDEPKIPASEVSYDNRGTTLISDNVQTAITELTNDVDDRCIWSNAVSCAVGDMGCTITDDNITSSSIVDVYNQNASGTPVNIDTVTRSIGQVVLAFNKPLTEATEFKLRIINRLGGGGGKRLDPDEITVTSSDQIIDGYIDYDHNGDLIIGTNLGYDAGVTQGHADRDAGVTITDPSHLIKGYKARNSSGDLLIGSDLGYIAGVMQGHTDRDTGVSLTAASQLISGYSARTSSGDLVTGTDLGYNAGVTQGENNMKSGVTVLTANHIINGYKARNSSGTLLTGTDLGYSAGVTQGHADRDTGVTVSDASHIINGYKARNSNGTLLTGNAQTGGYDLIYFNQGVKPEVTYTFNKDYKVVIGIALAPAGSGITAKCTMSAGTPVYHEDNEDNYACVLYTNVPKNSTVIYQSTSHGNNPSGSDNYSGVPNLLVGYY